VSGQALVDIVDVGLKRIDRRKELRGGVEHPFALGRQGETAGAAIAELDPEPELQIRQVPADGRAADVELQLRRGHAATGDHRAKHPQKANIDVADSAKKRFSGHSNVSR